MAPTTDSSEPTTPQVVEQARVAQRLDQIRGQKVLGVLGAGICTIVALPLALTDYLQREDIYYGEKEDREQWKLYAIILVSR